MIGDVLLYIGFLLSVASVVILISKETTIVRIAENFKGIDVSTSILPWFIRGAVGSITLALGLLFYYFVTSDFSIHYVWQYTAHDLPLIYKMSALWTGEAGSMMLFAWMLMLVLLWVSEFQGKNHKFDDDFIRRVQIVILLLALLLIAIVMYQSPFSSIFDIHPELDRVPLDGAGLNPLLVNIWMVFHPPGIFVAYGLMSVAFAASAIFMASGANGWEMFSRKTSRLAWLVLGAGIVSGCIWSYEVWEGYWIWDPAFTSSLMVWMILTAYLHASSVYRKTGKYSLVAPALAMFSFVLAIYSTYIIRSGLIMSAHAFGGNSGSSILIYTALGMAVVAVILLVYRSVRPFDKTIEKNNVAEAVEHAKNIEYIEDTKDIKESTPQGSGWSVLYLFSNKNLFNATLIALAGIGLILFWGLTSILVLEMYEFGASISIDLFGTWAYPFTIFLLFVMAICTIPTNQNRLRFTLGAIALCVLVLLIRPFDDAHTDLSATVLFLTSVASIYRIAVTAKFNWNALVSSAPHLVHLGVALLLVGVLMSTFTTSETVLFQSFDVAKSIEGYDIKLIDISFPVSHSHASATITKIATYKIYKDGEKVGVGSASFREEKGEFITEPYIYHGLLSDVYITYQGIGTNTPILISVANIKVVPGMTILWSGCLLLFIGIVPLLFGRKL